MNGVSQPKTVAEVLQQPIVVSSPGKVILFGEHSVVYGKRSLAFSLGLRTELTISHTNDHVELIFPEIDIKQSWALKSIEELWRKLKKDENVCKPNPRPLSEEEKSVFCSFLEINESELEKKCLALISFLYLYISILPHPISFRVIVKSQIPISAGLGSSAAYGVSLAGIMLWLSGQLKSENGCTPFTMTLPENELDTVSKWAFCSEQLFHGTPSGIDNAICTYGGGISYKSSKIEHLNATCLRIILVNTKVSRNTKELVNKVKEKYSRHFSITDLLLASMDNLAESALKSLNELTNLNNLASEAEFSKLCELIDMNHCLLSALGVSHSKLDELVVIARKYGLHAKLTGAGGGGCGFILLPNTLPEHIDSCIKELEAKGYEAWVTKLGGKGLSFNFKEN